MAAEDRYAQFGVARERVKQAGNQDAQAQADALRRRFASIGNLGSGASIKAEQQATEGAQARAAQAVEQVDSAEQAERARVKDVEEARAYQTQEREATQQYATKEREAGQIFNKQLFDDDMAFKKSVFQDESKFRQLNYELASQEFDENRWSNQLNAIIAMHTAELGGVDLSNNATALGEARSRYDANRGGLRARAGGGR